MPSPPSDDRSSASRFSSEAAARIDRSPGKSNPAGQAPLSRTGKFLQGLFGKKQTSQPVGVPPEQPSSAAQVPAFAQPPQELIQVVPEPTDWGDGEESNWDDDFMDEPRPLPPPPPPPSTFHPPAAPPPISVPAPASSTPEITHQEIEQHSPLAPTAPVEVEAAFAIVQEGSEQTLPLDATEPEPLAPNSPATPERSLEVQQPTAGEQITPESSLEFEQTAPVAATGGQMPLPPENNSTISVNIPRPKNIKYKPKPPQSDSAPTLKDSAADKTDRVEAIELNIKRPTTIKYKTKPEPQPSLFARMLAPGKELWKKIQNLGDLIPNQLMENPKKILGILAAAFLALVTCWAVINFWPSSVPPMVVSDRPVTAPSNPAPVLSDRPVTAPSNPAPTLSDRPTIPSQFSTLASQYPAGLITNLELDNGRQVAIITIGDLWASLTAGQQQQVAQSLWQQSQAYRMSKLELYSSRGNLLARSPIVGQEMVILASW